MYLKTYALDEDYSERLQFLALNEQNEIEIYAKLSAIAYSLPQARSNQLRRLLPSWTMGDLQFNTVDDFVCCCRKKVVMAFRGTDIAGRSDRIADVTILVGQESNSQRFSRCRMQCQADQHDHNVPHITFNLEHCEHILQR